MRSSGRLFTRPGETSKRLKQDTYAKGKYDITAKADGQIIARVAELADKRGVSMTASLFLQTYFVMFDETKATAIYFAETAVKMSLFAAAYDLGRND